MATFAEFDRLDGLGLADLVRRGEVTATELVEESIRRIEARNPALNAVIHPMFEQARRAAAGPLPDGPFRGVPFVIKDLVVLLAGEPYTGGSRYLAGWVPDHDSELVRRYRAAGFVFVGKTNVPEFGITPFTEPRFTGITRNPWNPDRTAGGSSGGTGAAVAAGMVPLGHGNDGGGSIRIPASVHGLFGLKPSRGRLPMGPDMAEMWHGMVQDHVLTRSVRDSAAALDATAGPDVGSPYLITSPARPFLEEVTTEPGRLRIAVTTQPFLSTTVDPECVSAVERTAALLEQLGHEVHEATPTLDRVRFSQAFMTMVAGEVATDLAMARRVTGRPLRRDRFEPETWALALLGRAIRAAEFSTALRYLKTEARRLATWQDAYDVLLTPTLSCPPPPHGTYRLPRHELLALTMAGALGAGSLLKRSGMIAQAAELAFSFIPWTPVSNVTGQPAMSVPLAWSREGLPIGLHFVGRLGEEATLFRLAGQLERAQPWQDRRPALATP